MGLQRCDSGAAVTEWGTGSATRDWRAGWTSTWEWNAGESGAAAQRCPEGEAVGVETGEWGPGATPELPLESEPSAAWKSVGRRSATVASCPRGMHREGPQTVLERSLSREGV